LYPAAIIAVGVTAIMLAIKGSEGCVGMMIVLGAALQAHLIIFRCPICYRTPMEWQYGRLWLVLNPTTCGQCGAPLGG
jgi:hypothetical protein